MCLLEARLSQILQQLRDVFVSSAVLHMSQSNADTQKVAKSWKSYKKLADLAILCDLFGMVK